MRQNNRYNPQDDLQNANQQNQYYEDDYDNEEYYDEDDQYYSPEQIERERRYLEQEEKRSLPNLITHQENTPMWQ